jgi:hypothetical protein
MQECGYEGTKERKGTERNGKERKGKGGTERKATQRKGQKCERTEGRQGGRKNRETESKEERK